MVPGHAPTQARLFPAHTIPLGLRDRSSRSGPLRNDCKRRLPRQSRCLAVSKWPWRRAARRFFPSTGTTSSAAKDPANVNFHIHSCKLSEGSFSALPRCAKDHSRTGPIRFPPGTPASTMVFYSLPHPSDDRENTATVGPVLTIRSQPTLFSAMAVGPPGMKQHSA